MSKILSLHAREVLDSRGNPTVEVEVQTEKVKARAAVPSGASTGTHEAVELRDGDPKRFLGKGVLTAVGHVMGEIQSSVREKNVEDQGSIDRGLIELDGTPNKGRLGANAILGVSLACARAAALEKDVPLYQYLQDVYKTSNPKFHHPEKFILPVSLMNVINGGKHADSGLSIQEFMIVPHGAPSFYEALRMGAEIFQHLKKILSKKGLSTGVGDEGGFAPLLKSNREALDLLMEAIKTAGFISGKDVSLALDIAASECGNAAKGYLVDNKKFSSVELIQYYEELAKEYPIVSIEDGLGEDDWSGWTEMNTRLGKTIQLVGDDLLVTNVQRLERAVKDQVANSILIKLNQIGTVTETAEAIKMAYAANWNAIVSHRSGETEDTFIADFAVAMGTGQIKTGSLSRSERIAKYNQLLRIEEELADKAFYPGTEVFRLNR